MREPASNPSGSSPVEAVFDRCERSGARMCVLRDADRIAAPEGGEVDLLIDPCHLEAARTAFRDEGFVELKARGVAPHRFFVRYEPALDRWIKCDVVTEITCERGSLRTSLAADCLEHRRRAGSVFVLSPDAELFTLLLHELLDKGRFRPHRIQRLKQLRSEIAKPADIERHLRRYWPGLSWPQLAHAIDRDQWATLLARRDELRYSLAKATPPRFLAPWRRRGIRVCGRLLDVIAPQAPSVSLLAPDGAGKTSLINELADHFFGPVCAIYMGLHQKQSASRHRRVPGTGLAVAVARQLGRYARARYRQACGQLVLFDRYTYDAWLPSSRRRGRWSTLRRAILARICPAPDLSVVLDVPSEILYARKPEHSAAILEQHRQCYRSMQSRVPRVVIVDATVPLADLRRTVMSLVWDRYRFGRHAGTTVAVGKA